MMDELAARVAGIHEVQNYVLLFLMIPVDRQRSVLLLVAHHTQTLALGPTIDRPYCTFKYFA